MMDEGEVSYLMILSSILCKVIAITTCNHLDKLTADNKLVKMWAG